MMKWKILKRFSVDAINNFDGTTDTTTLWAKDKAHALRKWKETVSYCRDPKVIEKDSTDHQPIENPEFGAFIGNMMLIGVERVKWDFYNDEGMDSLTTWVRDAVSHVERRGRDISHHETRTIVPKALLEKYGNDAIRDELANEMRGWERHSALRGQIYTHTINEDSVMFTIAWELDLS